MPDVPIIVVEDVKKRYRLGHEEVWALRGVSLEVKRGEFLSIMGPSGSGKSTLFNQIGALDRPTEGRVFFDGHSVLALSEAQQAWVSCKKMRAIDKRMKRIPVSRAHEIAAYELYVT